MNIEQVRRDAYDAYWCPTANLVRALEFISGASERATTLDECKELLALSKEIALTHAAWIAQVVSELELIVTARRLPAQE